jgi:hypothetical protein
MQRQNAEAKLLFGPLQWNPASIQNVRLTYYISWALRSHQYRQKLLGAYLCSSWATLTFCKKGLCHIICASQLLPRNWIVETKLNFARSNQSNDGSSDPLCNDGYIVEHIQLVIMIFMMLPSNNTIYPPHRGRAVAAQFLQHCWRNTRRYSAVHWVNIRIGSCHMLVTNKGRFVRRLSIRKLLTAWFTTIGYIQQKIAATKDTSYLALPLWLYIHVQTAMQSNLFSHFGYAFSCHLLTQTALQSSIFVYSRFFTRRQSRSTAIPFD